MAVCCRFPWGVFARNRRQGKRKFASRGPRTAVISVGPHHSGNGMISVNDHDGIAVVSIERAPVNALDLPMIEALESAFARLAGAPPRAGAVLTGAGKTFSAGVDTRAFASYDSETRRRMVLAITRMTSAILSMPCPLVAAVNGHALGGGFVLMLCCDYRLAVDDAALRLGLTEARAGVPFPA